MQLFTYGLPDVFINIATIDLVKGILCYLQSKKFHNLEL